MELRQRLEEETVGLAADFDSFFPAHFQRVARAAALVARDPGTGQDLAQEAFARLFERWSDMDSEDHARNFATGWRSTSPDRTCENTYRCPSSACAAPTSPE